MIILEYLHKGKNKNLGDTSVAVFAIRRPDHSDEQWKNRTKWHLQ